MRWKARHVLPFLRVFYFFNTYSYFFNTSFKARLLDHRSAPAYERHGMRASRATRTTRGSSFIWAVPAYKMHNTKEAGFVGLLQVHLAKIHFEAFTVISCTVE